MVRTVALIGILKFWATSTEYRPSRSEQDWLRTYFLNAIKAPFERKDAIRLVEAAHDDPGLASAVTQLVDRVLAGDPKDPLFRFFRAVPSTDDLPFAPTHIETELREILAEAGRRGDEQAARRAREALQNFNSHSSSPFPLPSFFQDEDEDDDGFDDIFADDGDEEDDDFDSFLPPLPSIPNARGGDDLSGFANLIGMLSVLPESVINQMRKEFAKSIPPAVFDQLVKIAKTGPLPKGRPGKSSGPDFDQLEMF